MASFAQIDENNIVTNVLVVPDDQEHRGQEFLAEDLGFGGRWIQTSFNTKNFQHPENRQLRGNFAGVGYFYDEENGVFIPPKPFPSFKLDTSYQWVPPFPAPNDGKYYEWDEDRRNWVETTPRLIEEGEPV